MPYHNVVETGLSLTLDEAQKMTCVLDTEYFAKTMYMYSYSKPNQRTKGPVNAHLRSVVYTNKHV